MTSKDPPADRPNSAGIKIEDSEDTTVNNNQVFVYYSDDTAFEIVDSSVDQSDPNAVSSNTNVINTDNSETNSNLICGGLVSDSNGQADSFLSEQSGGCSTPVEDELPVYLAHQEEIRTTTLPPTTTTIPTTIYDGTREIMEDTIVGEITTNTNIYVDAVNGDDSNDGSTIGNAKKTIYNAVGNATDNTMIYVLDGTYSNDGYNSGNDNNPAMVIISDKSELIFEGFLFDSLVFIRSRTIHELHKEK